MLVAACSRGISCSAKESHTCGLGVLAVERRCMSAFFSLLQLLDRMPARAHQCASLAKYVTCTSGEKENFAESAHPVA
jgi:hypothetical protein